MGGQSERIDQQWADFHCRRTEWRSVTLRASGMTLARADILMTSRVGTTNYNLLFICTGGGCDSLTHTSTTSDTKANVGQDNRAPSERFPVSEGLMVTRAFSSCWPPHRPTAIPNPNRRN